MARVELFFIDSSLCVTVQYMYSRYIKKWGMRIRAIIKIRKIKMLRKRERERNKIWVADPSFFKNICRSGSDFFVWRLWILKSSHHYVPNYTLYNTHKNQNCSDKKNVIVRYRIFFVYVVWQILKFLIFYGQFYKLWYSFSIVHNPSPQIWYCWRKAQQL